MRSLTGGLDQKLCSPQVPSLCQNLEYYHYDASIFREKRCKELTLTNLNLLGTIIEMNYDRTPKGKSFRFFTIWKFLHTKKAFQIYKVSGMGVRPLPWCHILANPSTNSLSSSHKRQKNKYYVAPKISHQQSHLQYNSI